MMRAIVKMVMTLILVMMVMTKTECDIQVVTGDLDW